ncbi:DUF2206 domain-containing protein [Candidatus Bathyarchaeota archaeon]|nr:DUF2206 domain-containing protein [Candidatus Bathyarchaeota archaeon]
MNLTSRFESMKWNRFFLSGVFLSQLSFDIVVALNITFARQVIGFVYLTLIPGLIIIELIKIDDLDLLEHLILSAGLSVASIMFLGLLLNQFYPLITEPLSTLTLAVVLNIVVISGAFLAFSNKSWSAHPQFDIPKISTKALMVLGLPILSAISAIVAYSLDNNAMIIVTLVIISITIIGVIISKSPKDKMIYPLIILALSMSLLLHTSLASSNLMYVDVQREYFVFQNTQQNLFWNSTLFGQNEFYGRLDSMLSITILPTAYASLLDINSIWVFKLIFPLLFSIVPLILYKSFQRIVGDKNAIISVFFFMAMNIFYSEMLGLARQMIAELFFALLLFVIYRRWRRPMVKTVLFVILGVSLIVSHYALAVIFFGIISLGLIFQTVLRSREKDIAANMVVFFFAVMLSWFIYVSNSASFNSLVFFSSRIIDGFREFFNLASRDETVLRGLGLSQSPSVWNTLGRFFAYFTEALIFIAFVGIMRKRSDLGLPKSYLLLSAVAMLFLASLVLVPVLAGTLNMPRFYHILLFILAPLITIGGEVTAGITHYLKNNTQRVISILLIAVLVPYFLFQSGLVYEVSGSESWSVPLSKYRMDPVTLFGPICYINDWKVSSASWLKQYVNVGGTHVYADQTSEELCSYGMLAYQSLITTYVKDQPGIVYLSYMNVVNGIALVNGVRINMSDFVFINSMNRVFSNGGGEILIAN